MKYSFFACLAVASMVVWIPSRAQTGSIAGIVHDQASGEELVGVNVLVVGSKAGAATDIDGKFMLRQLSSGTYALRFTFVGYAPRVVTAVAVREGEIVHLDVLLTQEAYQQEEVVTTARRLLGTEAAILADRKKAAAIADGISAEQIKRTPDATSGDALRRVTGLSIVDNKFVFIRGITDRYNGTSLDGASVATTEAGKKSFSFDQVPANLLENTTVIKTSTPDLPGDYTGGVVQMNTLDFPEFATYKLSLGSSYNTFTTGRSFASSQGGSTDWLGFDNGVRRFPGYPPGKEIYMGQDLTELAQKLPNNFAPRVRSALPNGSLSFSTGNRILFGDESSPNAQLGYVAALSYRTTLQRTTRDINDTQLARLYTGSNNDYAVLWGAIANLSYKFGGLHKVSFKNNFNQSSTDRVTLTDGYDSPLDSDIRLVYTNWTQRSVYTGQIAGEHELPSLADLFVRWHASVSSSRREDPDEKRIVSERPHFTDRAFEYATNQRSWAGLSDRMINGGFEISLPLGTTKVKAGLQIDGRTTGYQIAYLNIVADFGMPQSYYTLPLDSAYAPQNFGRHKWLLQSGSVATDRYTGEQTIAAGYAMVDIPFEAWEQHLRLTGGVRVEDFSQTIRIPRTLGDDPQYLTSTLQKTDALPSLNLTYQITDNTNLRLAYSHSVNRPEFRERSLTAYFDYVTYELVGGDTSLQRAYVHNYDVRAEYFPGPGEVIAFSYFTKEISNAIEERLGFGSTRERKPFNSTSASNWGWEFELRKSLDFLGGYFSNFSLMGNYTRVHSRVSYLLVTPQGYVDATRPMQGQSPYVVNFSFLFTEPTLGTSMTLAYNRFGRRLDAVGFQAADVYEEPRDALDLAVTQPFLGSWEARFTVRNLTNSERVLTRQGLVFDRSGFGSTYSLQLSLSL